MEAGQTIAERYEVEERLARGGMATVYRVRHSQLHSRHALKVLDLLTPSVRTRLLQEGRIQASLRHPSIVSVTDVLEVGGQPALVMEYVEGPTLTELLEGERPSIAQAEAWFRQILGAVQYAHSRGLVHRDLKPDNILMAPLDDGYLPKVADFGIAKVVGDYLRDEKGPGTRAGLAMGTPSYMPPEQINNAANVDHRADVFALGCVFYEMVTGKKAFESDNMLSVLAAVMKGDYPPPESVSADVPPRVAVAIRHALHPDPEKRLQDCKAFLEMLDSDAPPPDSPTHPTWTETPVDVPPTEPAPPEPQPVPVMVHPPPPSRLPMMAVVLAMMALLVALAALGFGGLVSAGALGFVFLQDTPEPTTVVFTSDDVDDAADADEADDDPTAGAIVTEGIPRVEKAPDPDWRVEVHSWRTEERVRKGVMKYAPKTPGGTLYLVDITIENLRDERQNPVFPWTMQGPDGTEYKAPLGCHIAIEDSMEPQKIYAAGEKERAILCFDGPGDPKGVKVVFEPGSGGDPPRVFAL